MLVLGIILLLVAAAIIVGVAYEGTSQDVSFTSDVGDLTTQPVWIFLAGAATLLLVVWGLWLIRRGMARHRARRRELKRLRRVEEDAAQERAAQDELPADRDRTDRYETGVDESDRQLVRDDRRPVVEPGYRADHATETGGQTVDVRDGETPTGQQGDPANHHRLP
jgi:hypothetical protein